MVKHVDNPTDAKKVGRSILSEWIGFLWLPPNLATLSFWSRNQHGLCALLAAFRSGRMETAFLDSSGAAGTLLEEADGSNKCPGPKKGP